MEIINARIHLIVSHERCNEVGIEQKVGVIPKAQKEHHVGLQKERKEWLNIMNIVGTLKNNFLYNRH